MTDRIQEEKKYRNKIDRFEGKSRISKICLLHPNDR